MQNANEGCKFGFLTDSHFSVIRNNFRTDNYFESLISKFQQCYEHFNKSGCEFIVHGGDVFDKYRTYSHPMLLKIREIIIKSKIPTYFIWGQHDLLGYNRNSSHNSNLEFLKEICDGKLIEIKDCIELDKIRIFASHVDQEPITTLQSINLKYKKPSIAVVHALLYNSESNFSIIDIRKFGKIHPTIVLSGDLHGGFSKTELYGTTFYNPGSLARTEKTDRKPKAAIIELQPWLTEWTVNIEEFFPNCEDFPFPKEETPEITVSKDQDSEEYIEAFEKFKSETKDIIERLEKVGELHKINKEVLEYIKSKKVSQ